MTFSSLLVRPAFLKSPPKVKKRKRYGYAPPGSQKHNFLIGEFQCGNLTRHEVATELGITPTAVTKRANKLTELKEPEFELRARLHREFKFDVDLYCETDKSGRALRHPEGIAKSIPWPETLQFNWGPRVCLLNGPWGNSCHPHLVHSAMHAKNDGSIVVAILPVNTHATWWNLVMEFAEEIRFPDDRYTLHRMNNRKRVEICRQAVVVAIFRPGFEGPPTIRLMPKVHGPTKNRAYPITRKRENEIHGEKHEIGGLFNTPEGAQ